MTFHSRNRPCAENQHRRLRAGTAVGIERHGIRVDAGNGLDADIARDIFSGDRDLAGGAVERVVCRVEHLITDGHIGIGGVAPHRRVVGQLIALVRDEPCGIILSLLAYFSPTMLDLMAVTRTESSSAIFSHCA